MHADGHLGIGDRLHEAPANELVRSAYAQEVGDGALLYHGMSSADLAHVIMLIESGIMPAASGGQLLAGLLKLHAIRADKFPFDPARGDVYSNREYLLRQKAPHVAGWLQAGRPRREVTTIGYLIVLRERLLTLTANLLDLMEALLTVAAQHVDTVMPDYTYLQTAHPTTLAHYLLTFVQPMTRDLARLQLAYKHTNCSPAGAGSTNGSRLPLDREGLASLLGFDGVVLHTRDAMWQPDGAVEAMSVVVTMMVNLDRLVEDLQVWATQEFGFVELADRHARVSVIMPQKKNPYSLTYIRGVARQMIGQFTSTAALQMTPSGQVDNRIFSYGMVPTALQEGANSAELLANVLREMTVNKPMLAQRAGQHFSGSTDLAESIMVDCDLDARLAHRLVGLAVRKALELGDEGLSAETLNKAAQQTLNHSLPFTDAQIDAITQPENIVQSRTGLGGASTQSVGNMLSHFQAIADTARQWQTEKSAQLAQSNQQLEHKAKTYASAYA